MWGRGEIKMWLKPSIICHFYIKCSNYLCIWAKSLLDVLIGDPGRKKERTLS
jgi:hypothetical protein